MIDKIIFAGSRTRLLVIGKFDGWSGGLFIVLDRIENRDKNKKRLGIYIHIPFCLKKCYYCDFLSAPAKSEKMEQYFFALKEEISGYRKLEALYSVQSIFLGGGTPTFPSGEWIAQVLEKIQEVFSVEERAEITIECNPETVDRKKLRIYREAGVNRISFGLQSADDEELKRLGRVHTYKRFLEAFLAAREVGFLNCNVDLMSGLPGQTLDRWEDTVNKVVALNPEHISAYSLMVEEGTRFYEMEKAGMLFLPDEEEERRMYKRTVQLLEEAGYHRYEISNYAKPNMECRHNMIYWTRQEYLGLGLGASSYMDEVRFRNSSNFEEYLRNRKDPNRLHTEVERLTLANQMEEFMFLGLRRMEGVTKAEFLRTFGSSIETIYGKTIKKWEREGYLESDKDRIWLTQQGIDISNVILADFLLEESLFH